MLSFWKRLLGWKPVPDLPQDSDSPPRAYDHNGIAGSQLLDQDSKDIQNAERLNRSMPGAFPDETEPPSPSQLPTLPPPSIIPDHDVPAEKLEELEPEPQTYRALRTELGSHLHPVQPSHTPSPKRFLPPSSAPAKAIPRPALQDEVDIEDPYMRRSMVYQQFQFGRPVSAVQLFSPKKRPLPPNRSASIYASDWEEREKEKKLRERDQFKSIRIIPQGPAVRQLSPQWLNRVAEAMRSSQGCVIARSPSGDDLYPRDIATCLKALSWLNDEIINSYLTVLVHYLRESTGNTGTERPRFHAFTTFFYTTLRDKGYQGVRRWANRAKIGGEGLLDVDTVFIPVHESAHWTLMVVRPVDRTIEYFDSLDRMGRQGARQVKNIKEWLRGELGAKYEEDEWKALPSISSQQDNGSDCGVFLLTNAKAIALGIEPTAFGPADTQMLRRKIVAELMNGGLHGEFCPVDSRGDKLL